jgi:hypothetical protein
MMNSMQIAKELKYSTKEIDIQMLAQPKKKYTDKWKLRPEAELVIALDDLDFSWYPKEITFVQQTWKQGLHIAEIAKKLDRDQDEVAALIMHLARRGKIKLRKGGVFGNGYKNKTS